MSAVIAVLFLLFTSSRGDNNGTVCNGIETGTFNLANVLGSWYVAGLVTYGQKIPGKSNPCFRVEFSEADEGSLKWLVKNNFHKSNYSLINRTKRSTIRLRYHLLVNHTYDTWSKLLDKSNGCFEKVVTSLSEGDAYNTGRNQSTIMQLHVLTTDDGMGPYLLQILWGEKIAAAIYQKKPGNITKEDLEPVMTFLNKIRPGQVLVYVCDKLPDT